MDRASDSGSEGWGFESLLAYQKKQGRTLASFLLCFSFFGLLTTPPKILRFGSNFWEGTAPVGHATGMSFVWLLLAYQKKQGRTLASFSFVLILCGERSITKGSENMDGNETEALLRAILELIEKCETLEELRASVKRIMGE